MSKVDEWLKSRPKDFESKSDRIQAEISENGWLSLEWNSDHRFLEKQDALDLANWIIDNYGD